MLNEKRENNNRALLYYFITLFTLSFFVTGCVSQLSQSKIQSNEIIFDSKEPVIIEFNPEEEVFLGGIGCLRKTDFVRLSVYLDDQLYPINNEYDVYGSCTPVCDGNKIINTSCSLDCAPMTCERQNKPIRFEFDKVFVILKEGVCDGNPGIYWFPQENEGKYKAWFTYFTDSECLKRKTTEIEFEVP